MKGSANNYQPDPNKQAAWLEEIETRPKLTGKKLLKLFSPDWIALTDEYQNNLGRHSIHSLIDHPFNELYHDDKMQQLAKTNEADYPEAIDDAIYEDQLMIDLLKVRDDYLGSEEYSELIRSRRTVLAYQLFAIATLDFTKAS